MKSKDNSFIPKRRGLSSIVGALLFVVLMVATFAVLGVALDSQTEIVDTSRDVADTGLKKQQEKFIINNVVQVPSSTLQIHATNKHPSNPTEIFTLIMTNSSDIANGFPTTTIEIPSVTSFLPPGTDDTTDIIETLNLKMKTPPSGETDTYKFKVISSLGNIEKFNLICDDSGLCAQSIGGGGGTGDLAVQLFLDGPNGVNTKTSTVIMFVSNIGDGSLKDVWPVETCPDLAIFPFITQDPPIVNPGNFLPCDLTPTPDPSCGAGTGICMAAGQTMIFKWDGTVSGDVGDVFNFCNSVSGKQLDDTPVSSNTDCDSLTVINPNDCGGCEDGGEGGETIILLDDLLIRPSLFLTMPSPYGNTGSSANENLGVWGVNVANPTNSTMDVSKVTITAFAPGANNNVRVFDETTGSPTGTNHCVSPNGPCALGDLGDWNLDDENVLVWRNFGTPITLPPYSIESFMLKVKPFTNGANLEAVIVQTSVFTTSGSFGKSAYQTTMFSDTATTTPVPIANIYLSATPDSRATADILGHMDNLVNGTIVTNFSVVLADMDENKDTFIKSGARIIVNLPREWTFVEIHGVNSTAIDINALPAPLDEPSVQIHGDGSTQIIATTNDIIGDYDLASNPTGIHVATLSFSAIAPEKEVERMYIMYILGDGLTEADKTVGPLSEVVLHVIGNVTGYP